MLKTMAQMEELKLYPTTTNPNYLNYDFKKTNKSKHILVVLTDYEDFSM